MIIENVLVSSDVYFVSVSVVWTAGAWHIKSRSPLYSAPMGGILRGFPIAANGSSGILTTGNGSFPNDYGDDVLYSSQFLSPAISQK